MKKYATQNTGAKKRHPIKKEVTQKYKGLKNKDL
jgi:hypothetical protein